MADKLFLGLETTVIGVGIVFLALYGLSLILQVFQKVFYKEQIAEGSVSPPAEISTGVNMSQVLSGETVAAIAAAIAVVTGKTQKQFSIVSIKSADQGSAWTQNNWKMAGRNELMEKRQEHYR